MFSVRAGKDTNSKISRLSGSNTRLKLRLQLKEKLKRISGTKFIIVSDLEMTVALSLGRIQREINMIFSSLTEIQILFRPPN